MNKFLRVILLIAFTVLGCAAQTGPQLNATNSRIRYRDLTVPKEVRYKVPTPDANELAATAKELLKRDYAEKGYSPAIFIEFENESSSQYNEAGLEAYLPSIDRRSLIFLIGHSHGSSGVGTLKLASQRANRIKSELNKKGYQNVYVMASWGQDVEFFAPSRGVHLYVIRNFDQEKGAGVPLIFTKNTEVQHDSIQSNWPTVACSGKADGFRP
jgi:hypothetical protein